MAFLRIRKISSLNNPPTRSNRKFFSLEKSAKPFRIDFLCETLVDFFLFVFIKIYTIFNECSLAIRFHGERFKLFLIRVRLLTERSS